MQNLIIPYREISVTEESIYSFNDDMIDIFHLDAKAMKRIRGCVLIFILVVQAIMKMALVSLLISKKTDSKTRIEGKGGIFENRGFESCSNISFPLYEFWSPFSLI